MPGELKCRSGLYMAAGWELDPKSIEVVLGTALVGW